MREGLVEFLRSYKDCFAWGNEDMIGIDPSVITHALNVNPKMPPVKQKRRKFAPERNQVINDEVKSLLESGKIREVKYPEWLANVVVVKKKNGKWRVCVDFTDLNKACPKDSFPLPHIDAMVDATAGHELLTFMDAFSGYHQIMMNPEDQEKTAFVTNQGTYCYKVMPFGLKNAGATYQRLVNKMFQEKLGDTMEVYIDDMLVKSLKAEDHITHLRDAFQILREYKMKLNPTKCSFGVTSGKFLGYIVTQRGIEASPEQVKAIMELESPKCVKDVQKLTGRIAALNRFISRSSDRNKLFYDILKKNKSFEWKEEHEKAFEELKQYLSSPQVLSKPQRGEKLYVYLAVTEVAVSVVLIREKDSNQLPIYYVSKTLLDAETRYSPTEKLVLSLVMASIKLRPYFESHSIIVRTNYPMKSIMSKPELSGRLTRWLIHLNGYDISYEPRTAIKSQALADFVVDFTPTPSQEEEQEMLNVTSNSKWLMHTDGASNQVGVGLGVVLKSPQGDRIAQAVRCTFKATNNEAEYEALIAGLLVARDLNVQEIEVICDSLLIVNQVTDSYVARDSKMKAYLEKVREIVKDFKHFEIKQVPRDANTQADALANLGSAIDPREYTKIPFVYLDAPSIVKEADVLAVSSLDSNPSWVTPYLEWLQQGVLPEDKEEAKRLKVKASTFTVKDNILFKWMSSGIYARCVQENEVQVVLRDIHDGECGNHIGGRNLAKKASRMGYYWPTMNKDAVEFSRKCDACQRHGPIPHLPSELLHPLTSPWPFMKWGMDIVGKLPPASGQRVYLLAMTDYFSKWIEAEAFKEVKDTQVISFIRRNILSRFGIPSTIVCDNGSQFISDKTKAFCQQYNIQLVMSTPRYPQANGQAEASNKVILNNLKKRLKDAKGKWADELPLILWSDRITPKTATGHTPFSLVYGCEAVLPVEVSLPTARYGLTTEESNISNLLHHLDTVDELRDEASIRLAAYKQGVARSYNKRVNSRAFQVGDWVLRKVFQNTQELNAGKLGANWEGPYQITKIVGQGAYELESHDGKTVPRSWNAMNLKLYHF